MTAKQQRFVDEYLIDLNATQAATRAGYSPKRADAIGYENLRKPEIAAAVTEAQTQRAQRIRMDADKVLADLERRGNRAEEAGQFAAAIQASVWQGKHLGMFVERRDYTHTTLGEIPAGSVAGILVDDRGRELLCELTRRMVPAWGKNAEDEDAVPGGGDAGRPRHTG